MKKTITINVQNELNLLCSELLSIDVNNYDTPYDFYKRRNELKAIINYLKGKSKDDK